MDTLTAFFDVINNLTWGWALIPILVVFGVFLTIMSGFVQIEFFGRMFRVLSGRNQNSDPNAISAREALLVSVGGRVGGGNIAGVAVAITLGGPGAVFWMWAIALAGMATSLIECTLASFIRKAKATAHSAAVQPIISAAVLVRATIGWRLFMQSVCLRRLA
jgi:AGCS family alanine or glycine:cation symporter